MVRCRPGPAKRIGNSACSERPVCASLLSHRQRIPHPPKHLHDSMPDERPIMFGHIETARFVDRPNRFLVRCRRPGGGTIKAFLPNPGRMWELLLPNVTLYLTSDAPSRQARPSPRKTRHTVLAVERDGRPIFLHTHLTNRVARHLIERRRIPGLENADVIGSEVPLGNSRFDFLLREPEGEMYLEVKSCTLFGNGVAMFPDAVTERGRRHLLELAELSRNGARSAVLFLVHTPKVRWFMPDYHTDLAFSQAVLEVRDHLRILPVAIEWKPDLSISSKAKLLEVPWSHLEREVRDSGSYLLILRLPRARRIEVGGLGSVLLRRGYYVYVGSAMRNLSARVARHVRLRKTVRWHIDYLRREALDVVALPIRSSQRQECGVATALSSILESGPDRFGSSDCACPTHLLWARGDPLHSPAFHSVLQAFRMRAPEPSP